MVVQFSIAQARDRLARLVHDAEKGKVVELTRRGKPVAVLLSNGAYRRHLGGRVGLWKALMRFRRTWGLDKAGIDPAVFRNLRDRSPGRRVDL